LSVGVPFLGTSLFVIDIKNWRTTKRTVEVDILEVLFSASRSCKNR